MFFLASMHVFCVTAPGQSFEIQKIPSQNLNCIRSCPIIPRTTCMYDAGNISPRHSLHNAKGRQRRSMHIDSSRPHWRRELDYLLDHQCHIPYGILRTTYHFKARGRAPKIHSQPPLVQRLRHTSSFSFRSP